MTKFLLSFGVSSLALLHAAQAEARTVCTLMVDVETGDILHEEGDCGSRTTPASTFKIPLAVMGYDSGFLKDAETPRLPFRAGDPDWGGANWKKDTTPESWLRYSVVWYSQRITHELGASRLSAYARSMGYGNADFSGDKGFDNGLDRAWIASSLQVSPGEQVAFMRALVLGRLPVTQNAIERTRSIVERTGIGRWTIHGKTGGAYPRRADRSFDYARGWGWFVGWAEGEGRRIAFARLTQDERRDAVSPGIRAKKALLEEWPALLDVAR
ncbi:class D beta-lactamase [Nitratireductor indicus]|uniref:beta-lactamase n=1 Tax=Nitratireductor indicus C115 TaxID=1231190 RepID=K2N5L4_9HYPH|nr:class D beta-lactamase [Nitratireductor indicus]EKF42708.1 beta-lactamase class D [Nitratireductor indicus C115]MDS1134925.1 class D beta-lactamase [Nitratireductor indicus]SFQ39139.1 beta-lactamase class D [Nitratireductor indicus]